ncbi:MAG: hypothetical protein A2007_02620 [Verrucomicrobia bacterium GWC2_42_7]|nr:MAG: hypothetical protein A2007_02620 [Verrucomicrobia bacterium GWC2_42_7]
MQFWELFIRRPVMTIVVNLMIVVIGLLAFRHLTVREYPDVRKPELKVCIYYPNANADTVEAKITLPLERMLAGVEGVDSMTSYSEFGESKVVLDFIAGFDIDKALASVRDKLSGFAMLLPKEASTPAIFRLGNNVDKVCYLSLSSADREPVELTHYCNLYLQNMFKSLPGVASVDVEGQVYTMRITLDRAKMFIHGVSANDVIKALEDNQITVPAGKFQKSIPISLELVLSTPQEFEDIVVKQGKNTPILLKNIAQIELDADKDFRVRLNGKAGVFMTISKSSDGNPLEVSERVQERVNEINKTLPKGMHLTLDIDKAEFIRAEMYATRNTLIEAFICMVAIIFLFLRRARVTLIPLITIPISLVGTFFIMQLWALSVNVITLLAMILAIGLVVDDAIVVLENTHRHIESGLTPLQATRQSLKEISFAVIAMTFTLASVYLPIGFVKGPIGSIFREFALTLSGAVAISGFVALTLTPMMCSKLLRKHDQSPSKTKDQPLNFSAKVNSFFTTLPFFSKLICFCKKAYRLLPLQTLINRVKQGILSCHTLYVFVLEKCLTHRKLSILIVLVFCALAGLLLKKLPHELVPKEDRGLIGARVEPLSAISTEEFDTKYVSQIEKIFLSIPEVENVPCFSWGGADVVASLKDFSLRKRTAQEIIDSIKPKFQKIPSVSIYPWSWDNNLPGLDHDSADTSDFSFYVQTTGSYEKLFTVLEELRKMGLQDKIFKEYRHDLNLNQLSLKANIDQIKASLLGISTDNISKTLQTSFGDYKKNSFLKDHISYFATIKTDENLHNEDEVYLINFKGNPVSLSSIAKFELTAVPPTLMHYNQMRAALVSVDYHKGANKENVINYVQKKLSEWTHDEMKLVLSKKAQFEQENLSMMFTLFGLAILFIYFVLAIQFESFVDPLLILLTVPLASSGAILALKLTGSSLNTFSQVGLITLIGLVSKHGILLVDFANLQMQKGLTAYDAIKQATRLRIRPIMMTTIAMIISTIPLMLAKGPGGEFHRTIGITLFGGLLIGTLLTLFLIPTAYLALKR